MENFFTLLGLEQRFDISEEELQQKYVAQQQACHPDKLIGKSQEERAKTVQRSMQVNDAYETLREPLSRAQHMLALEGIHVNGEEDTVQPDPSLLMEMMELRERLQGAAEPHHLMELAREAKDACQHCSKEMQQAFETSEYQRAAQLAIRLRYLVKLLEEIHMHQYQRMRSHS